MDYYTNIAVSGNNILYRGIKGGRRVKLKTSYSPSLFIHTNKNSEFKTLSGDNLEQIKFNTISDAKKMLDMYKDVSNYNIYGQEKFEYAFIADYFKNTIEWNINDLSIAVIDIENGRDENTGEFPSPLEATGQLTAITINYINGDIIVFGYKDYTTIGSEIYIKCESEYELCVKFLSYWQDHYPDIITGWNSSGYDIPYIINRFNRILGEDETKKLSPWNNIWRRDTQVNGRDITTYNITGISSLDYLELYKLPALMGASASQESYKLDYIAEIELGEKKLSYDEYDNLDELYIKNPQKYIEYNIHDTTLILKLENKLKLLELVISIAYDSKTNYVDIFYPTRLWDSLIYSYLLSKNIIIPLNSIGVKTAAYEGAYVKPPIPGKYDWLVSFDISSLYPSLIVQNQISPEKLITIDYLNTLSNINEVNIIKKYGIPHPFNYNNFINQTIPEEVISAVKTLNFVIVPNGQYFNNNIQGFMGEMVEKLFNERQTYKRQMLDYKKEYELEQDINRKAELTNLISRYNNIQHSRKIALNSLYGAMGTPYFRFYDIRLANAITLSGQLYIKWIMKKTNEYFNKILNTIDIDYCQYQDTDSLFLNFKPLLLKVFNGDLSNTTKIVNFLDTISDDRIAKIIDIAFKELSTYTNTEKQFIQMHREKIILSGIWKAKKRYILNVIDNEGVRYSEPKLSITGMEMVVSTTPKIVRNKMKELLHIVFNNTEKDVQDFILNFSSDFKKLLPEDIAFNSGVNGIKKYQDDITIYKSKTPIHTRGSINYNNYLNKLKLDKRYEKIRDGDKIKYIYLQQPNPLKSNVIAFSNKLPEEFNLHKYIDYNKMWDKVFIEPISSLLECIGYDYKQRNTLDNFFDG